jgi:Domain of unknown function (DUF4158)
MEIRLSLSYLGIFTWTTGIVRRLQFGGVTTIAWATALQLCTVRFLGTFLADPTAVPRVVIAHLAKQLDIAEPSCLLHYRERPVTRHEHAAEIQRLNIRPFRATCLSPERGTAPV